MAANAHRRFWSGCALEELRATLTLCVETYNHVLGADAVRIREEQNAIYVSAGEGKIQTVTDIVGRIGNPPRKGLHLPEFV
jgi:hypothetical protein